MVRKLAAALLVALILVPFTGPFPTLMPAAAAHDSSAPAISALPHHGVRSHDGWSLLGHLRLFTRALDVNLTVDRVGAAAVVRLTAFPPIDNALRRPSPLRI